MDDQLPCILHQCGHNSILQSNNSNVPMFKLPQFTFKKSQTKLKSKRYIAKMIKTGILKAKNIYDSRSIDPSG